MLSVRPVRLTGGLAGLFPGMPGVYLGTHDWPPQITSRDLVPMAQYYSGFCEEEQCH